MQIILSGPLGSLRVILKQRVLFKPVLGSVAGVELSLMVMNRLNQIWSAIFVSLVYSLLSNDLITI